MWVCDKLSQSYLDVSTHTNISQSGMVTMALGLFVPKHRRGYRPTLHGKRLSSVPDFQTLMKPMVCGKFWHLPRNWAKASGHAQIRKGLGYDESNIYLGKDMKNVVCAYTWIFNSYFFLLMVVFARIFLVGLTLFELFLQAPPERTAPGPGSQHVTHPEETV